MSSMAILDTVQIALIIVAAVFGYALGREDERKSQEKKVSEAMDRERDEVLNGMKSEAQKNKEGK